MTTKVCKCCGEPFEPHSNVQNYCNREITRVCKLCGKQFTTRCNPNSPEYCSRSCASRAMKFKEYICECCGEIFHPNSSRQRYCKKPIHKTCIVCGKDFTYPCGPVVPETCDSLQCKHKLSYLRSVDYWKQETRICEWPGCGKEFHPVNNTQKYCEGTHYRICEICGSKFEVDTSKNFLDIPRTCSKSCSIALRFQNGNPFHNVESREKAKLTSLERYGVEYPAQSKIVQQQMWDSYKQRTGYDHPSHNPDVRSKSATTVKHSSKFESRIENLLQQYDITYQKHYMISTDTASHEFDFYIPKYKILVDCDGVYYHGYLSDPDGKHVLDCYDEDRISLIPSDHIFHVIVEGQEEKDINYLVKIIKSQDNSTFDYEGDLFSWCRNTGFPYPVYTDKRLLADFHRLCNYHISDNYNSYARLGDSIIQQFHHSIYDARVGNYLSPKDAWEDDTLLKKVILNRLIYKNDVDPFKILKGFNISKICPRVSVFNPVLARYLVQKYLSDYSSVFDPFSGFSGRMLGVASCDKDYIGQDLNSSAVEESNQIIKFLNLTNCSVSCKDILQSYGDYECLLSCPPYYNKEHYRDETVVKTCDEWIGEILSRFRCNRYVFVVDYTDKYKCFVKEEIKSTSHLIKLKELVIVIDKQDI